jgi:superfamily II DNA or RNA helicase
MLQKPRVILFASTAMLKATAAGERWVTVHPHGPDSKGQPILIQPQPDGSAKVIGGAGGSLNHMRLTGIKPKTEYTETLKERARDRRAARKRQRDRDKALGLQQAKADAHKKVTEKTQAAQRDFVSGVAQAMGWAPEDYKFQPPEGQADHVVAKMHAAHLKEMVKRAEAAVKLNRERILADASTRAHEELGEVPLDSEDANTLSVQDLDPVRTAPLGLGFATEYKARAEANGADEAAIKGEAAENRREQTEAQRKAAVQNGETARLVAENVALLREPDQVEKLAPKLVEAKQALDLLKLEKKRKMAERQAKQARKQIDDAIEAPKAYIVEVDDAKVDAKVAEDVANDLRTISTRAFLSEVEKTVPDAAVTLRRHVGAGAYNSVNALALAAGGAALVDRSVVDVLGIAGAAEVLARRLHADLTPDELRDVSEGMTAYHLHHYMEASEEAIGRARELQAQAREMELGAAENGEDLAALQEINRQRGAALGESRKVLGTALGEMEANAALVYALGRGKSEKPFVVPLGDVSMESAIAQVRAIGLQRGDYSIETAAGNRVLKVNPQGLDRLAAPVNRADLEQVRRNLDIISGRFDEDDWMPQGISDRPDLDMKAKPGVAPQLAEPFAPGADLEASVRDYIGGRAADGDAPADIVADLQSADFMRKVGADRVDDYRAALDRLAPLADDKGNLRQPEALRPSFEEMADAFASARGAVEPLHRQNFHVDETSIDALHRALTSEPTGVAAYKPVGELTPQDQGALRDFFAKHVAKESPEVAGHRAELGKLEAREPERHVEDMFGEQATNPEWSDWRNRRDELRGHVNAGSMTWAKYVEAMRSPQAAYAATQDLVRSQITRGFADAYNTLKPASPLKVGRSVIRSNLDHLDAVDPAARDARLAKERALSDSLRNRVAGRYASGSVRDRLDAAREEQAGLEAAQMGFFADEPAPATEKPLGGDERWTIGHEAERRIAEMMPQVGANFRPGQPVHLFRPSMSGGKNYPRQRAIKMLEANKRVVLSFGTGSGKTLIGLGGFTQLHSKGAVKRGLFLVPSIAQGGFGAESLRFLKPGAYRWHAKPGASRSERIAAYKDPSHHFCVMTHQSFRDDMLHLGAQHAGVPESELSAKVATMSRAERKDWIKGVMRREGIAFDYLNVDEGHDTLNRRGKENSAMSNVIDALGDHTPYYVNASADPIKNDVSEAFSLLQKMDPERYTDEGAFMRRYGVDTLDAKDGLRRELARFQYPSKIDPDITANRVERKVSVSDAQHKALSELDGHMANARIARMQGKVDVSAVKAISPSSFEGVPPAEHEAIARDLQANLGILKQTAVRRLLDAHPESAKVGDVLKVAAERKGKQGVVFAHSLEAVEAIKSRLASEGFRVGTITGKDSAKDKAKRIGEFRPASGAAAIDVMVCSDAGATGANLQSGQWLVNYDTPDTAKTHAQRNGRINRIGQTQDVDLIDLVSDHPEERRRRDRLEKKYALREMMTTPMESLDDTGLAYFLRQRQIMRDNGAPR